MRPYLFIAVLIAQASWACAVSAMPAERLEVRDDAAALVTYIAGDAGKPLVVFIPGAAHLARIAYGDRGSRADDFLAYWLHQEGYGFLAISYPLGGTTPAMVPAAPQFSPEQWGRQSADITRDIVEQNHLCAGVILVGWSMGGRILEPYAEAAAKDGVKLSLFVSLSSTPGFERHSAPPHTEFSSAGYAHVPGAESAFERQLAYEAKINGHIVLSARNYERAYIGDPPIGLTGWGLKYSRSGFVADQSDDKGISVANYAQLPLIAALHGDSPQDPLHALGDQVTWGFVLTNILVAKAKAEGSLERLNKPGWEKLSKLVAAAPSRMSAGVAGNHFFFVGRKGAKETTRLIEVMDRRSQRLWAELSSIVSRQ